MRARYRQFFGAFGAVKKFANVTPRSFREMSRHGGPRGGGRGSFWRHVTSRHGRFGSEVQEFYPSPLPPVKFTGKASPGGPETPPPPSPPSADHPKLYRFFRAQNRPKNGVPYSKTHFFIKISVNFVRTDETFSINPHFPDFL